MTKKIYVINKLGILILVNIFFVFVSCSQDRIRYFVSNDLSATMKIESDSVKLYVESCDDYQSCIYVSNREEKSLINKLEEQVLFDYRGSEIIVNYNKSKVVLFSNECISNWDSLVISSNYLIDSNIVMSKIVLYNNGEINLKGKIANYFSEGLNEVSCSTKSQMLDLLQKDVNNISANCFKMWNVDDSDRISFLVLKKYNNGKCEIYKGDIIPLSYVYLKEILSSPENMFFCH